MRSNSSNPIITEIDMRSSRTDLLLVVRDINSYCRLWRRLFITMAAVPPPPRVSWLDLPTTCSAPSSPRWNSQTCSDVAPFAPPGSPPRALSSVTASTPTLKPPASSSIANAELCSLADKTTYAPSSFPGPPISDRYIVGSATPISHC